MYNRTELYSNENFDFSCNKLLDFSVIRRQRLARLPRLRMRTADPCLSSPPAADREKSMIYFFCVAGVFTIPQKIFTILKIFA